MRNKQRHDGLDSRCDGLEHDTLKLATDTKQDKVEITDQLKQMEQEYADWDKEHRDRGEQLHTLLATQEAVLTQRIEEFKTLFVKADSVFQHSDKPKAAHAPAATSAAGAQPNLADPSFTKQALAEAKKATDLLRARSMRSKSRPTS